MTELITEAQRKSRIACVVLEPGEAAAEVELGEYTLTVRNTQELFAHMLLDMGLEDHLRRPHHRARPRARTRSPIPQTCAPSS